MQKFLLLSLSLALSSFVFSEKIAAQCQAELLNCNTAIPACDFIENNPDYWNEIYWWDNANLSHDLAEMSIDLTLSVRDTCPGNALAVRCLLFLDLDNDGVQETVVNSDSLSLNPNVVFFNNANSPNYTGGSAREFDSRPLPSSLKWQFALQNTVSGNVSTYNLRWTTGANPVFVLPELPHGNHKVRWVVTNNAGGVQVCEKPFEVKDCKPPVVVCLNGLSVNIMPTGMIQLWSTDFLQYTEDNVTPTGLIKMGLRKAGTGSGFPVDASGQPVTSLLFDCDELGTQSVELWAIDVAGNADFCSTFVIVQDNLLNCENGPVVLEACVTDACAQSPEETVFNFEVPPPSPFMPPISYFDLGACGTLNLNLPSNVEVVVTPENDVNPLDGVTTFDMVIMQNHIDGVDLFDTPYQWVAADANNDKVIDTLDVLECKKLILGIYTELPNNTSWRFVDKSYVFPSPDPLSAPFPESITVNSNNLPSTALEFVGVKICDVTCGNLVGFFDLAPENQHLIGNPSPNPTSAGASLPIQLLHSETVLLEVIDLSGKLLFQLKTTLPEGPALLEIPASALSQSGVYFWRVRAGEVDHSGKIVRY